VIRRATPADAATIAAVQARAWRHAYADILEPDDMPARAFFEQRVRERLAEGERDFWVWDQEGRVAGFVAVGPSREAGGEGEVHAIYVDPPAQGAGVGSALLAHGEELLRAARFRGATLRVFEANGQGRAFYERHGWRLDAAAEPKVSLAPEVRYRRAL
jgi:ribosomal protein S18 acetylase RimI-like enzyme